LVKACRDRALRVLVSSRDLSKRSSYHTAALYSGCRAEKDHFTPLEVVEGSQQYDLRPR